MPQQVCSVWSLKALSDETIFAHDSLRFASGGTESENLTNCVQSDDILPYQM